MHAYYTLLSPYSRWQSYRSYTIELAHVDERGRTNVELGFVAAVMYRLSSVRFGIVSVCSHFARRDRMASAVHCAM